MHSSRMRTVRSSSHVYPNMHWAGGCVSQNALGRGGVYPSMHLAGVVSAQWDVPGGYLAATTLRTVTRQLLSVSITILN